MRTPSRPHPADAMRFLAGLAKATARIGARESHSTREVAHHLITVCLVRLADGLGLFGGELVTRAEEARCETRR